MTFFIPYRVLKKYSKAPQYLNHRCY
jgi:hypothetical protein